MTKTYSSKRGVIKSRSLNKPLAGLIALVAVGLVLLVLEVTNTTSLFHKQTVPPVIPVTSQKSNTPAPSAGSNSSNKPQSDKSSSTSSNTNLVLYAPYGDFVSNHRPGYNGVPTSETSVCNTTPGATCYIKFTSGSTSTSLPSQKTNSSGVTYWYWDTKKANLTTGNWTVTAVASLNGQSKSTKDPILLTIQ